MKAIEFRRILCPINFAEGSRRTVEGASVLAAMYDAELRLFHVACGGRRGRDEESRDAESLISSLFALTHTLPERTRVSAALSHGDPTSEIIQHARLMRADLIVLGSERRSMPADVRRTIAADIATHAGCPVLYVRPHLLPSLSQKAPGFTEILCCVDPASGARALDDYANALAHRDHARVTLLNVVGADEDTSESPRETATDVNTHRNVVQVSLTGQAGPEVVALAKQIRADLIVVGAQDEGSPERTLGSTTAHLLVYAPCPVLIVPRARTAFPMTSNRLGAEDAKRISQ